MLKLFPMLTSFSFLSQHLGSGPHYLVFHYSDNLLFLLWLPSHFFFLSGPPPHHPLGGTCPWLFMSQSFVQTAAPPSSPHLDFTVQAHWIDAKLLAED